MAISISVLDPCLVRVTESRVMRHNRKIALQRETLLQAFKMVVECEGLHFPISSTTNSIKCGSLADTATDSLENVC
ncbi:hypothetical protein RRG08_063403 [Elysia crispata]|uniref:Uncharacterized protein n=1 Tax=Elysia crispata TaxID=231223 RepID=A0AAE1AAK5_9GAST|nr:hypothetical protein RRG08_063403 [Elysia crispata]